MTAASDDEDEALLAELRRVFAALDPLPAAPPPTAAPPAARPPRPAGYAPTPPDDSPDRARPAGLGLDAPGRSDQPGAGRGRLAWDDFELRRSASSSARHSATGPAASPGAGPAASPAKGAAAGSLRDSGERGRSLPPVKGSPQPPRAPTGPARAVAVRFVRLSEGRRLSEAACPTAATLRDATRA
nr:hypothetical protein GCM10020063_068810 [Dactylosporangium thailandense]